MAVQVGTITPPSSPGTASAVFGGTEPWTPTWIMFVATNSTSDGWETSGASSCSRSFVSDNDGGTVYWACQTMNWTSSANRDQSLSFHQGSGLSGDVVNVQSTPSSSYTANRVLHATLQSLDTDGFTLNFDVTSSSYRVHYVAISDKSFGRYTYNGDGLSGDMGFTFTPADVVNVGFCGIGDVGSTTTPITWGPGSSFAGTWAVGRAGYSGAGGDPDDPDNYDATKTVSASPASGSSEHYNNVMASQSYGGDTLSMASEPWFFGAVAQGTINGYATGGDIQLTQYGSGTGYHLYGMTAFRGLSNGGIATVSTSVSGTADSLVIPTWTPHWCVTASYYNANQGWNYQDADHAGFSIGAADENGNQWLVAVGKKYGTANSSRFRSSSLSWMTGWDPHSGSTPDYTAGTMSFLTDRVRFTTSVVASSPKTWLPYAHFDTASLRRRKPNIYRIVTR